MSHELLMRLLNVSLFLLVVALGAAAVYLYRHLREREEEYMGLLLALSSLIELKDPYTEGHCARVRNAIGYFGAELGLSKREINDVIVAATLHDIGKMGVPDEILKKPGRLDDEEFGLIKRHSVWGADSLGSIRRFGKAATLVRHHHEAYDGGGYPDGLSGEAIPVGARIIAVLDAYDAMTSDRAYRKALTPERAREILMQNSGRQFDPDIVRIFLGYEAGEAERMLDPVCGMPGNKRMFSTTDGRTVFFCSEACREKWRQNPEKYRDRMTL